MPSSFKLESEELESFLLTLQSSFKLESEELADSFLVGERLTVFWVATCTGDSDFRLESDERGDSVLMVGGGGFGAILGLCGVSRGVEWGRGEDI